MTLRLETNWKCAGDTELTLRCDVARMLAGIAIPTAEGADSTHSAPGDALAARLKQNIESAFALARVGAGAGGWRNGGGGPGRAWGEDDAIRAADPVGVSRSLCTRGQPAHRRRRSLGRTIVRRRAALGG